MISLYCKSLNKHNLSVRIICVHRKALINAIAYKGHISIRIFVCTIQRLVILYKQIQNTRLRLFEDLQYTVSR